MKKKRIGKSLYFTLPIIFVVILFISFSVHQESIYITEWSDTALKFFFITFLGPIIFFGLGLADAEYDNRKRYNKIIDYQELSQTPGYSDWNEFYHDRRTVDKAAKFRMSDDEKLERID